jgi:hypothetical protein
MDSVIESKRALSRSAVFTINNYTEESVAAIESYFSAGKARYIILGFEVAPTTGTPHIQGYIQFTKPTRLQPLRKTWKAWMNPAKGTPGQNRTYCSKDSRDVREFGEIRTVGEGGTMESERWARNIRLAEEGNLEELKLIDPVAFTRCYRTYKTMKQDSMKRPDDLDGTCGVWIWGATGVGKSRSAREHAKISDQDYYEKPCSKWWDGYQDEPCIIIEDWDYTHKDLAYYLKLWTDRYAFIAETKGGPSMKIRPKIVIITSQYSPDACFPDFETRDAIKRRCKVHHMGSYNPNTNLFG